MRETRPDPFSLWLVIFQLITTIYFDKWLKTLRDRRVKNRVLSRLARVQNGNFGDAKQISADLFELRLFYGGGIRIYYTLQSNQVVLLLVGGDKSTQNKDIKKAQDILAKME